MKRISSPLTYPIKLLSLLLVPYLALQTIQYSFVLISDTKVDPQEVMKLIFAVIFTSIFVVVSIRVVLPLKTIYVDNDSLIVGGFFTQTRLPFAAIWSINGPDLTSFRRIEIELKERIELHKRIIFMPHFLTAEQTADTLRRRLDT